MILKNEGYYSKNYCSFVKFGRTLIKAIIKIITTNNS